MAKRGPFEPESTQAQGEGYLPKACLMCRTMLAEAIDGTLQGAERTVFERHIAGCAACRSELAEAQRGEAWLSLLKSQMLEPPADLLARVLAVTSAAGAQAQGEHSAPRVAPARPRREPVAGTALLPGLDMSRSGRGAGAVAPGSWLSLEGTQDAEGPASGRHRRTRGWASRGWAKQGWAKRGLEAPSLAQRAQAYWASLWAMPAQPRLAMTVAMAFFSIALTLNLIGVRLRDLRAGNLSFSALKRTVADADASAARLFQNNRAVYQMESRLNELRSEDEMNGESPDQRR